MSENSVMLSEKEHSDLQAYAARKGLSAEQALADLYRGQLKEKLMVRRGANDRRRGEVRPFRLPKSD